MHRRSETQHLRPPGDLLTECPAGGESPRYISSHIPSFQVLHKSTIVHITSSQKDIGCPGVERGAVVIIDKAVCERGSNCLPTTIIYFISASSDCEELECWYVGCNEAAVHGGGDAHCSLRQVTVGSSRLVALVEACH